MLNKGENILSFFLVVRESNFMSYIARCYLLFESIRRASFARFAGHSKDFVSRIGAFRAAFPTQKLVFSDSKARRIRALETRKPALIQNDALFNGFSPLPLVTASLRIGKDSIAKHPQKNSSLNAKNS